MTAWIQPSARTIRWTPLIAISIGTALLWAFVRAQTEAISGELLLLACGAIAAAAPLALDDPGRSLLSASPTTERRRLLQRLAIVGPAVTAAWLVLAALAASLFADGAAPPGAAPLAALALAGVAVLVVALRHRPAGAAAAGAAACVSWVAARWYLPDVAGDAAALWLDRPAAVIAVAVAAVILGART